MTKKYIFLFFPFVFSACSTTKKPSIVTKAPVEIKTPAKKATQAKKAPKPIIVGRYLTYSKTPVKSLLDEVIKIRVPAQIHTISGALRWILMNTGYDLARPDAFSTKAKALLSKRLPARDRSIGPVTVRMCLKQVIGPAYTLQADPINRTIKFDVKR